MSANIPLSRQEIGFFIDENTQIGLVRKTCFDRGVKNIDVIADCYQQVKERQTLDRTWCYENFTERGSDSSGTVINFATGQEQDCVIWPINHYLALNRNEYVLQQSKDAIDQFGTGCGTSAMSGGHNKLHKILESRLATMLGKEDSILFSTGYSANLGAISGLAKGSNNLILVDRECHASIIDGCKLAGCEFLPFRHNDTVDLEKKLTKYHHKYDNVLIIVESVYSMTGEVSPLRKIIELKKKFPCYLFVDEAHAFGLYGSRRGGVCDHLQCQDDVDFIMTSLSKATGSIGGVVACSKKFKTLLQVEANAYLFQAALPPSDTAAVLAALDVIEQNHSIVDSVWSKTKYMRKRLAQNGFDIGMGESPIIPVYVRDSALLMKIGFEMFEKGIFTTSVAYPVVKHTEVRFP
ncbi:MAG: aminotransferase class I/II-fold pyridoxal phosphate-dependent enzyme [Candidatus Riflebacteria bacterium]